MRRRGYRILPYTHELCCYWKVAKDDSKQWISCDFFPVNSNYEFLKQKFILAIKLVLNPSFWQICETSTSIVIDLLIIFSCLCVDFAELMISLGKYVSKQQQKVSHQCKVSPKDHRQSCIHELSRGR